MALEVGSEEWLDVPLVTGESESGELVILARVKNCTAEIHNAARQMDGGPGCPPLYRARARTQAIEDNTLRVAKKKKTKTTQVVGAQKRKLPEESKPQTIIYVDDPPSDDHHSLDGSRPPGISPPAKRVRREEILYQSAESRPQPDRDPRGALQRPLGGLVDNGSEIPQGPKPHGASQRSHGGHDESGSEQVRNSRGVSQQPVRDDTVSNQAGGSRLGGFSARWNDADDRNHERYDIDVNMYNEGDYDAFMDDYQATRFEPTFSMENQYPRPRLQFSNNQHGLHPQQYVPPGFGGRGRGVRPQYRGHGHPYGFNGYYGQGNEGFTGYGPHRLGRGPSESGDEERFTEGNVLRRRQPGEGRGF